MKPASVMTLLAMLAGRAPHMAVLPLMTRRNREGQEVVLKLGGTVERSRLLLRSRVVMAARLLQAAGSSPVSALSDRSSVLRPTRLDQDGGSGPDHLHRPTHDRWRVFASCPGATARDQPSSVLFAHLLPARLRFTRLVKCISSDGRVPCRGIRQQ